jgi:hypothetical protein
MTDTSERRAGIIGPDKPNAPQFYLGDASAVRLLDGGAAWNVYLPGMTSPVLVQGRPWLADRWRELKAGAAR